MMAITWFFWVISGVTGYWAISDMVRKKADDAGPVELSAQAKVKALKGLVCKEAFAAVFYKVHLVRFTDFDVSPTREGGLFLHWPALPGEPTIELFPGGSGEFQSFESRFQLDFNYSDCWRAVDLLINVEVEAAQSFQSKQRTFQVVHDEQY